MIGTQAEKNKTKTPQLNIEKKPHGNVRRVGKVEEDCPQEEGSCMHGEGREKTPHTRDLTQGRLIPIMFF